MFSGYETLVIAHPDIPDEELQEFIDKIKNVISRTKGEFLKIDKWGKRKLVYKIKGLSKGVFFIVYFLGNQDVLQEIDRLLRFNERILRYQTVKIDKKVDIETLREKVTQETLETVAASGEEGVPAESPGRVQENIGA
ncbi:MAG TPA: 30S ribosomal protein S6 [Thermodesulfobacteriota bacterium]|nr:30S ribosomal protein S6 [Thermodesulfobacteriota bacterium]